MILPLEKDLRLTLVRRGGSLSDEDHRLLALWAADCAERVLAVFEAVSVDPRPLAGPPRWAAYAAAQAALVAHVPAHDLGAAAYAIRASDDPAAERSDAHPQSNRGTKPVPAGEPGIRRRRNPAMPTKN